MIYKDERAYLEGYTEYLALDTGLDYKIKWNKQLRQLQLSIRAGGFLPGVYAYHEIIDFDMADLKNKCVMHTRKEMIYLIFAEFAKILLAREGLEFSIVRDYKFQIDVANHEELAFVLGSLEEVGYFRELG